MTLEEIETEYWADHYFKEGPGKEEFDDDDFDEEAILAQFEAEAMAKQEQQQAEQAPPDPGDWEDI